MPLVLLIVLLAPWVSRGDDSLFQPSVRSPRSGEIIYFLLPDRFNDGDPSNNTGGAAGADPNETGFDPVNPNFFHG
jgi:neopullulanase